MSVDMQRRYSFSGSPQCLACSDEMHLAMIIPPFGSPYGLKVYTCRKCGRSESYLTAASPKAAQVG
jgi:hypothetical protein